MKNNSPETPGHETSDVRTQYVWFAGAGLAIICTIIAFAIAQMFNMMQRHAKNADQSDAARRIAASIAASRERFPRPQLQFAPEVDLAALRAKEDRELTSYGWIDKEAGVVRIPIDRAMELIAQRGLPMRDDPDAPKPYRTTLDMQQVRPLERETTPNGTPAK